jgi:signal transduction histidine kinase/DNA-binding response OmpR family regulator
MALFGSILMAMAGLIIFFLARDRMRSIKQIKDKEEARKSLEDKNKELAENREALSEALIAAEHANRAKTTFLNNMSHDIRTPMNAIVGFTALAASHIDNKEQVQDYLSKISVSSQHLLSLINDVLDMSRIESGNMKIEEGEVHLPDIIHDLRNIIQANITAKQQELFIDTQDVIHEDIITDKLRLNQILLNILSNAIKFTPAEGTISLRIIEKPSDDRNYANYEFRVKDNGIGMSEEFQKTIFEAFTRERTSTISGIQGTGLGMAITKNIVDMMGGTIEVRSKEGKGSEFIVNIRCHISDQDNSFEMPEELKGLRILVADDDINTCLSVSSMLRQIGMRADWTQYGKEAVIRAQDALDQSDSFKAFIIDWMMPDMNGIETVRRIRKVIGNEAPIIILSAYDWADIEEEAREAGVTAFVSKPIFLSELRQILAKPFLKEETDDKKEISYDFSGKKVLLAEDNQMNQQIALAILENVGFTVDVANNGKEAVDKIESSEAGTYDVVLMDIQMPVMDGYEASKAIRQLEDLKKARIPIIAVTANAFEEDRKDAAQAGMNSHLAKPYEIDKMMETLADILK